MKPKLFERSVVKISRTGDNQFGYSYQGPGAGRFEDQEALSILEVYRKVRAILRFYPQTTVLCPHRYTLGMVKTATGSMNYAAAILGLHGQPVATGASSAELWDAYWRGMLLDKPKLKPEDGERPVAGWSEPQGGGSSAGQTARAGQITREAVEMNGLYEAIQGLRDTVTEATGGWPKKSKGHVAFIAFRPDREAMFEYFVAVDDDGKTMLVRSDASLPIQPDGTRPARFESYEHTIKLAMTVALDGAKKYGGSYRVDPKFAKKYGIVEPVSEAEFQVQKQTQNQSRRRRPHPGAVGSVAEASGIPGTVDGFFMVFSSKITQYDQRVSKSEAKKGRVNIYRLGLFFEAMKRAKEDVKGIPGDSSKPEDLKRVKDAMLYHFARDFPPAKAIAKQIDDFLATGKQPSMVR